MTKSEFIREYRRRKQAAEREGRQFLDPDEARERHEIARDALRHFPDEREIWARWIWQPPR